jgi:two-component system, NarL family, invasion response regulator UvrY
MFMVKLIIADDHFQVRQAWSWVLNKVDRIEVIAECASGEQVIEAAKKMRPDIILMDIHMQPVNGILATLIIRDFAPDIGIIGISVQAEASYVNEMLRSGARGFVTKNSPSTEMITAIDEVYAGNTYLCEELGQMRYAGQPLNKMFPSLP